ncbi:ATP-binding protein [Gilvimarinus sp. SDUM040013]|uniref:histidine kinase n=1 Tax=Gilvimarinus gilvus TaxID=3058038 RepID=A0ABU4S478_9GAMM|nr:ATP-binding protein [Gilvimarinus sp. SDUM040013]MDO3384877.1 ATP-binding protein [Gilvimarinus sp. SDUM040013]MDX6850698.1 ATP-binding protein [Gilvimarinus sp. SDUM040013]
MQKHQSIIEQGYDPYQLLRVFTYYRVLLGCLMLLIYSSHTLTNVLGSEDGAVFSVTCWVYTIISLTSLLHLWRNKHQPSIQNRVFALLTDIVAITLMMYSSGGATSGLGYLMIVSVAAAGMLLPAQMAIFIAALATIALIGESIVHHIISGIDTKSLFSAGSLGALIFLTAIAFQYVTGKIRRSTAELKAQTEHVAHLQKLARLIVERMRTGIVVLNKDNKIELINNSARSLLGLKSAGELTLTLENIPAIKKQLENWRNTPNSPSGSTIVQSDNPLHELKISLAHLELGKDEDTLVFVEDNRAITQQAQQLKLASLGRLTASIAHEIRNPLSAISHASELLDESDHIDGADKRLLEIIKSHTLRVNQIIENILQVSRRRAASPTNLDLTAWTEKYVNEFGKSSVRIKTAHEKQGILAPFDPSQLHQVMTNLIDNALRYADIDHATRPPVEITTGELKERGTPYLKITDNGPGIPKENQKNIFEPFFTTENNGSGLGLFICKELCEANQAYIDYHYSEANGSEFTIQFAHPQKVQK